MAKFKVEYDKESCIGTLACIQEAEDFFKEDEDSGKATLVNSEYNEETGNWELIIEDEDDFEINRLAADACPVNAIEVTEMEE
jgi:ferredoxin